MRALDCESSEGNELKRRRAGRNISGYHESEKWAEHSETQILNEEQHLPHFDGPVRESEHSPQKRKRGFRHVVGNIFAAELEADHGRSVSEGPSGLFPQASAASILMIINFVTSPSRYYNSIAYLNWDES